MVKREDEIYKVLARYMSIVYPEVIFRFDYAAGMYMSRGMANKHSVVNPIKGYPDLFVAKPNKTYSGLFIEIKAENVSPFMKSGKIKSNEHLERQLEVLSHLKAQGYYATFGVGADECIKIIDWYLK